MESWRVERQREVQREEEEIGVEGGKGGGGEGGIKDVLNNDSVGRGGC